MAFTVLKGTASEATLVALLGAKAKALEREKKEHPDWDDFKIISKLVAYASEQAHSSVERAGLLGGVKMRLLPADEEYRLRGATLEKAIEDDVAAGLIPFYVSNQLAET
ncbi:hypothetical protein J437_LFUL019484 [Ladona fulva]|uniref:Aromatic-L-amino-acid decarboxylase n=1 Tax=Ladona fulva TaxID=123851 RepID=A0A8K0KRZ6_LADFU|nr:hypothetical protein J437_LFUL019484 [Ladona fulva]